MASASAPEPTSDEAHWPAGDDCPTAEFLRVVGGKWKPLIVFHLHGNAVRFGAMRRMLDGITPRTLTRQLRELEEDGIVARRVFEHVPPHVEYSLTELGRSLLPVVVAMARWGEEHLRRRGLTPITDRVGWPPGLPGIPERGAPLGGPSTRA